MEPIDLMRMRKLVQDELEAPPVKAKKIKPLPPSWGSESESDWI